LYQSDPPSQNVDTDEAKDTNSKSNKGDDVDATTPSDIIPTDNDVLLGRGAFINDHPGNRQFRTLALEHKTEFDGANAADKRNISTKIVELFKGMTQPPHRLKDIFLFDASTKQLSPFLIDSSTASQ
jgi:hypothetical protein